MYINHIQKIHKNNAKKIWSIQKKAVTLHRISEKQRSKTLKNYACPSAKNVDSLAQQVEHNTFNVGVLGSSPRRITDKTNRFDTMVP